MPITILIHSSKTMRSIEPTSSPTTPQLMSKTRPLAQYLRTLSATELQTVMNVSEPLASKVHALYAQWCNRSTLESLAIDSFVGDIYSGLRTHTLNEADRQYAQKHLRILSGLYGILRPFDGVRPYRLEMAYKLPDQTYSNLYKYWDSSIAETMPTSGLIVNLSAAEYTKTVIPFIGSSRLVAPRFLSLNQKTGKPRQVIVHTKIARGAFARWLITNRVTSVAKLSDFNDLNYRYSKELSTNSEPTFICIEFGGLGLSVRLEK